MFHIFHLNIDHIKLVKSPSVSIFKNEEMSVSNRIIKGCYNFLYELQMGCVGSKKQLHKPIDNDKISKLLAIINQKELRLLRLLYQDCASRSAAGQMTLQNFLLFFHKNGYWGERLFKEFDTGNTNTITEQQFLKGIVKIFKTTEQKKIQLLYKFFSDNQVNQGIQFTNFLKMLYNYPKEEINKIINDTDFVNNQLKGCLVGLDKDVVGRRLESLAGQDLYKNGVDGRAFRLQENVNAEDAMESKYGTKIINELNKRGDQRTTTLNVRVGQNNVQIKTTSVHQLVKRFARSIFKKYQIDQKTGRLKFEDFRDWVKNHKNLYSDYYEGFHSQMWEVDKTTNCPKYINVEMEYSSKARIFLQGKQLKVTISLLQSILIICNQSDITNPIYFICLEGLSVNPVFDNEKGYGIQITHRDGVYQKKAFYLINEQIQKMWMDHLKFFRGESAIQIYQIKQQIGIGKFSVVYHCVEKATNQSYAIKVIESYKLDDSAKKIIAHQSGIMSVMSHPLLVFFKQTIVTKTHIYIVTELVKGKDLFSIVKQFKYLKQIEACYILQQIIIGVRYIHSLGIVHRDLKPENIMVEYDDDKDMVGNIKIIDFGFANYLSNLMKMPRQELLAGTPNYIAPQILMRNPFNEKIDNFAIGSILYFMLSGNLPFNSIDVSIILQKTVEGAFALHDKIWRNISEPAKDLVSRLLQNDPKDRITLDEALNHPWIETNRKFWQNKSGIQITKHQEPSQKEKTKSTLNGALIF